MERLDGYSSELRMKGAEMRDLPDCIYLSEKGKCLHLKNDKCGGFSCSFLTTRNSVAAKESLWAERLCSLSEERQKTIAKKYYNGAMPWKTGRGKHV